MAWILRYTKLEEFAYRYLARLKEMRVCSNKAMRLISWRMSALQSTLGQQIYPVLKPFTPGRSTAASRHLHGNIGAASKLPAGHAGRSVTSAAVTGESDHAAGTACGPDEAESLLWRKTYQLSGRGNRNQCSMHTSDGFSIDSDIPKAMGGGNTAPQPVYLLLAALVGCETATANFVGEERR